MDQALKQMLISLPVSKAVYTALPNGRCYVAAYNKEKRFYTTLQLSNESIAELKSEIIKELEL